MTKFFPLPSLPALPTLPGLPVMSVVMSAALAFVIGCPAPNGDDDDDDDGNVEVQCTEPTHDVPCRDDLLIDLQMNTEGEVWTGAVENNPFGDGFHTKVDATAGGAFNGTGAYLYGKFTDDGLVKVELGDDDSFDSMDWDIAFRRFVVRLNSGTGGPSCVTAARTAANTKFNELTDVPEGLDFNEEQFVSPDTCDIIPDGSGLGSPGVVLQSYWSYTGCVQMTGNVYVIQRADGRHVKFEMTHFYDEATQLECQETGSSANTGAANLQFNWAFLD